MTKKCSEILTSRTFYLSKRFKFDGIVRECVSSKVTRVILHRVRVVEIGVHEEGEMEKEGEVQVEVERERSKRIKKKRSSWMAWR